MKSPLQITFRDMVPLPSVEPEIRRRADKLDQWTPDVMSCRVVGSAFGAADRQLEDYVRRRRGQVKLHRSAADERMASEAGDEPPP